MTKLSKDKQNKILLIAAGTLILSGLIWYFVIGAQNKSFEKYQESIRDLQDKISKAEMRIRRTASIQAELSELRNQINEAEAQMIPPEQLQGKKWLLDKLDRFIGSKYDVTPTGMSDTPIIEKLLMLPKFAYSGAGYVLELRATYHEFGKFLADFENSFPYLGIQQLRIWPLATLSEAGGATTDKIELSENEREQLKISMRVVLLFKPAGSP